LRNSARSPLASCGRAVGDLCGESLPLPNSSRTISTMSSACESSLGRSRSSDLGPAGEDLGEERSLKVLITVRIWSGRQRRVELAWLRTQVPRRLPPSAPCGWSARGAPRTRRLDLATISVILGCDPIQSKPTSHGQRGLFVGVLHDEVLVEDPNACLVRCRRQADNEGVEVVENLSPEPVDRAMHSSTMTKSKNSIGRVGL